MSADGVNRETVRDQLTALLSTALVDGSTASVVYGYKVGDFNKQSPVVVVTSAGTDRGDKWLGASVRNVWALFNIYVFIRYAIEGTAWGEDDAEDRLDLIEKKIADVLTDNAFLSGYWDKVEYQSSTDAQQDVEVGGVEYRREIIPIRVRVVNG